MKLLLDQGLPRGAVFELQLRGIEAVHVSSVGMATASDAEVLECARREKRVVVTLDADFHALLALANVATPSTIRIRIEGLRAGPLAELLTNVVALCKADLESGAMVTVDPNNVRVRLLPLVRT